MLCAILLLLSVEGAIGDETHGTLHFDFRKMISGEDGRHECGLISIGHLIKRDALKQLVYCLFADKSTCL